MAELRLSTSLQFVKGVGPARAAVLAEHGLTTVYDLLQYYPRHYLDRTSVTPIRNLKINASATIIGQVRAHGMLFGKKKRYEVMLEDPTGAIMLLFFGGLRFWEKTFKKGQVYAATGLVGYFLGLQMVHPDLERLDDESDKMVHAGRIIPVYPQRSELTKVGLTSKGIRKLTTQIFGMLSETIPDPLPPAELSRCKLPGLHASVTHIHYPETREQIEQSRRRLAFDELLQLQYYVFRSKGAKDVIVKGHSYAEPGALVRRFGKEIPFVLTDEQKIALREIVADLRQPRPMSRLLHGEVGSGKTVVAVTAAVVAAENNLQCAFMAPTEILAEQHYRTWHDRLANVGVESGLLLSKLRPKQKTAVAEACARGDISILFGTHALIYDYVQFARLGLVVIDEQHRFGVEQRGKLYAKGDSPDLLIMTATPIPRTLALTLYGDLSISTIAGLPPGRLPIRTVWRTADTRDKIYQFVEDEIKAGGQAYIVYPLIDKTENQELESVEEAFEQLSQGRFKSYRLGLIHGRLAADKRDATLEQFRDKKIDILLSTTVVEVGIDNPNATIMLIEHAERFGLAQLHQLRGRVGRGPRKSTVVAVAHPPLSELAEQRLEFFAAHFNGFEIAEADLMLRGPGEVYGIRQAGLPELRAANFATDKDLLDSARGVVEKLFSTGTLDGAYKNLVNYLETTAQGRDVHLGGG
ncbi:MAG: ATP-dependent DNA helicase RecG [candidate division Zixibacteria bacterium]|nr:ATP-dependent DNA helicase RecG [candidate division Zixibacteria bacterium]